MGKHIKLICTKKDDGILSNNQPELDFSDQENKKSSNSGGSFLGDTMKLVSGTTIAQLLVVLASPLLTRFFSPEAFGLLAIFTSLTGILAIIVCMRFELAIVLPESNEEASNILALSLIIAVIFSILIAPIIYFFGSTLSNWLNAPNLNSSMWLVPLVVFFGGLGMGHPALNYWATRTRSFKQMSITRIIGVTMTVITQLGFGFTGIVSATSFVGASVAGSVLSPLVLAAIVWKKDKNLFLQSVKWKQIFSSVKRYRKFPLYGTWSAFLNNISWQLPVLLLSSFFSTTIVGYYSLGFRILQLPMNLVGNAISQVFFQRAAEAKAQGTLTQLVEELFQLLVNISLLPILILTIISRDLFIIVFGPDWAEAGLYLQILSVWAFFWFISGPFSTLFAVLERQELQLKWNILTFTTRFVSLVIGGLMQDARLAIILFSFTGVLIYGYKVYINLFLSKVSFQETGSILLKPLLKFLPVGLILIIGYLVNLNIYIILGIALVAVIWHTLLSIKIIKNAQII